MLKVKYVGFGGYMEVPCYEDENGKLWIGMEYGLASYEKGILRREKENNGRNGLSLYTGAYREEWGEICGEPNRRVTEEVICDNPFVRHPREMDYMMLSRLKADCDYFLGNGNGYEGHLYYKSVEKHCNEMEKLWNSFAEDEKPEWLTMEQIKEYREQMLNARRD